MTFDFLSQHTIRDLLDIIPNIANRAKNNYLSVTGADKWMITISRGEASAAINRALREVERR